MLLFVKISPAYDIQRTTAGQRRNIVVAAVGAAFRSVFNDATEVSLGLHRALIVTRQVVMEKFYCTFTFS